MSCESLHYSMSSAAGTLLVIAAATLLVVVAVGTDEGLKGESRTV